MLGSVSLVLLAGVVAATPCESLRSLSTPQVAIVTADMVPAGPFVPPGAGRGQAPPSLPAHCTVAMVLKPTPDSHINVELWMPAKNWNGKFLAVGNGGFAGSIQGYGDIQTALRLGYATAGTDTGHSAADGPNGMFALGYPEKVVDFAYRAVHTAGFARSVNLARHADQAISPAKASIVTAAVLQKCDTLKDGFLNNPRQCRFDFSTLLCKGADADTCLTRPQLQAVEDFYGGLKTAKGELIFSGQALGNPLPPMCSAP